nr:hypothetical protein [Catenulispora pinistramenti]
MIAVALGLIGLVVMIATGVAASSTADDHLTFLGVGVQTTTAQVFLTGAIFGWVFVIALWLLRLGMHRSGERCAQLAARRSRRATDWLGFTESDADDDGWAAWSDWGVLGRRPGNEGRGAEPGGIRFRTLPPLGADGDVGGGASASAGAGTDAGWSRSARSAGGDDIRPKRVVGRTGPTRYGRSTPWRPGGGADKTNRTIASTSDQPYPLRGSHPPRPVTGRPGIGMDSGTQRREIGGGPGPMPGENRGPEGEHSPGEGGQQTG